MKRAASVGGLKIYVAVIVLLRSNRKGSSCAQLQTVTDGSTEAMEYPNCNGKVTKAQSQGFP